MPKYRIAVTMTLVTDWVEEFATEDEARAEGQALQPAEMASEYESASTSVDITPV